MITNSPPHIFQNVKLKLKKSPNPAAKKEQTKGNVGARTYNHARDKSWMPGRGVAGGICMPLRR